MSPAPRALPTHRSRLDQFVPIPLRQEAQVGKVWMQQLAREHQGLVAA